MASKTRPQSARAIANYFISLMDKDGDALTPMQILKLVYIAHGWNLAINGRLLVEDPVEAWRYGPVIPDLYHGVKKFGRHHVIGPIGGGRRATVRNAHEEDIDLAETILAKYRDWEAFELSRMTHHKGTPWYIVWHEQGGKFKRNVVIPNELIQDHFIDLGNRILAEEDE